MATIGPTLPPEFLSKRKRSSSSSPPASPPAKRSRSSSPVASPKQARAIGPSLPGPSSTNSAAHPPADPKNGANDDGDDNSSTDSEIGPSLPSANTHPSSTADSTSTAKPSQTLHPEQPAKPQREDWMLAPPSSSDWTNRVDPTKLKARRFNTGKPSNPAPASRSGEIDSLWTETPEQKRRRLEDEVVGRKAVATGGGAPGAGSDGSGDRASQARRKLEEERRAEMERKVEEINEREGRGGSLYEAHRRKRKGKEGKEGRDGYDKGRRDTGGKEEAKSKERWQEEEDDPSKRGFDREKDMGLGGKVGYKARSDMTREAKGFSGRFGKGGYL